MKPLEPHAPSAQVLDVICMYVANHQRWPQVSDLVKVTGLETKQVYNAFVTLERTGRIVKTVTGEWVVLALSDGRPVRLRWVPVEPAPKDPTEVAPGADVD